MPKPLVVTLGGLDLALNLVKVDRSDLYGFIDVETLDQQGRRCSLATLADDGRTLIGASGSAITMLSPDGLWMEKKELTPTDNQGKAIQPVPSSYSAPVPLTKKASVEDYLNHNIRSVYQVSAEGDLGPLLDELKTGTIFQFPYSFRGGLEADAAFLLLSAEGDPFIAIGAPTALEMVGLEQYTSAIEDETESGEDDPLDFGIS